MQVTKEMQGIEIKGFAIYGIDRELDNEGPFLYYKYMTGNNAQENVKTMCESIARFVIANAELNEILTNREVLKTKMEKELINQLRAWGIWIETIEINDVK